MTNKANVRKRKVQPSNLPKQAAIYLRVSSERQAVTKGNPQSQDVAVMESPKAQEADCRTYCETRGYIVADVYRDIERYRVGKRLVEPSGTRADRPQLRRMIADANAGRFDLIIAWREDRLYRSYRPMLDVLDCLEQNGIDIELVKETFDRQIAPVKAWAARMELDAKHDRFVMGVAGRLAKGKTWNMDAPYGYRKANDHFEIDPVESLWVGKIFQWYADGLGAREIRRRLIAAGAPQKQTPNTPAIPWNPTVIYKLLRREAYATGRFTIDWNGQLFEIQAPVIVAPHTAALVSKRHANHKEHPAAHVKYDYLAAGLAYCGVCGVKLINQTRVKRDGRPLKTPWSVYRCPRFSMGTAVAGCPHQIGTRKFDAELWGKLWALFAEPGEFERRIRARIVALKAQEKDAGAECEKLDRKLDELATEEQWVITQRRKKTISEAAYEMQLAALAIERAGLERERDNAGLLIGNRAERLVEAARTYREDVQEGAVGINDVPETPEQAKLQFAARRRLVERLVLRVELQANKSVKVDTEIDLKDPAGVAEQVHINERTTSSP